MAIVGVLGVLRPLRARLVRNGPAPSSELQRALPVQQLGPQMLLIAFQFLQKALKPLWMRLWSPLNVLQCGLTWQLPHQTSLNQRQLQHLPRPLLVPLQPRLPLCRLLLHHRPLLLLPLRCRRLRLGSRLPAHRQPPPHPATAQPDGAAAAVVPGVPVGAMDAVDEVAVTVVPASVQRQRQQDPPLQPRRHPRAVPAPASRKVCLRQSTPTGDAR